MANRGELHLLKDSCEVYTAKTVTGQLAVILSAEPKYIEVASVSGDPIYGVALWDGVAGDQVTVVKSGFVRVQSGAALAFAAEVMSNGSGKFITATSGEWVAGRALEAASGADEEIEIELFQSGYYKP